jgi:hypothetical protein
MVPAPETAGVLVEVAAPHGILPRGGYRYRIEAVARALRELGIHSFLPHRDINLWGKRHLSPSQVVDACTQYVFEADVFVGILGASQGSHYEFGLAHGSRKPSVVIQCDELKPSFISQGITEQMASVLVLRCATLADIPSVIMSKQTRSFLSRYIPVQ